MKILTLISLLAFSVAAHAQQQIAEEQAQRILAQDNDSVALFKGAAVGVDLFGLARYKFGSYGNAEAALRINLTDTFFPIFELGYGMCDHTNDETNISYKSKAPYFRVGCDYNMLRNKHQGNRLYAGVRFGYTKFKYDVETHNPIVDPVWGGEELYFNESGISSRAAWGEIGLGFEAQIISGFHMGWSLHYKRKFTAKSTKIASPWYIPGYGNNRDTQWGLNYSLIFDLHL